MEKTRKNLEKRGYVVSVFDTAEQASVYLEAQIHGQTVGFGGSMTVEKMRLYERLSIHNDTRWHHRIPEGKTSAELRDAASKSDVYISSVNALAQTGAPCKTH